MQFAGDIAIETHILVGMEASQIEIEDTEENIA